MTPAGSDIGWASPTAATLRSLAVLSLNPTLFRAGSRVG